jgi:hypothetical protein
MDKSNPPRHYGVFKPVGHTVLSFATGTAMENAARMLTRDGFAPALLVRYSPQDMLEQAQADLLSASPLASVGQELNLVKAYRTLAEQDHSFLVVDAPDGDPSDRLTRLAATMGATSAQRYGRFIIEDLDVGAPVVPQSFESPDRAMDLDPPTGNVH